MNPELKIQQEQPLSDTEAMINGERVMTSESYPRFIHEISRLSQADSVDTSPLKAAFDNIHYQGAKNLSIMELPDYPGVREIYTKIDGLSVIESLGNASVNEKIKEAKSSGEPIPKAVVVVSSSVPAPMSPVDGGTHTAFDIVVGQVMRSLPKILGSLERGELLNYEVIALGSPLAVGGTMTPEFLVKLRKDGFFNAQAQFHAEYLNKILKSDSVKKVMFTGLSFGALQSIKTASWLSPEIQKKASVLADNPAPVHGNEKWNLLKGAQVFAGFVMQAAPLMFTSMSRDAKAKPSFEASYSRQMERLGIRKSDSRANNELRDEALKVIVGQVMKGPLSYDAGSESLLMQSEVPVYVRQSVYDVTTTNMRSISDYKKWSQEEMGLAPIKREGDSRVFPYSGQHFINRYSDKDLRRWLGVVKKLDQKELSEKSE
jgi:hypothetical protein